MKIVQLIPLFEIGGAQRMVVLFAKLMTLMGHKVTVIIIRKPLNNFLENELQRAGAKVVFLGKPKSFRPEFIIKLYFAIRREKPDIVHSHLLSLRYVWLSFIMAFGVRFFHTIHNTAPEDAGRPRYLMRMLNKALFFGGIKPITISKLISESFSEFYNMRKPLNVNNGIDLPTVLKDNQHTGERYIIACVASFLPQKNQIGLIKAATPLLRQEGVELWFIGDGMTKSTCVQFAEQQELTSKIVFWGNQKNVAEILLQADAFALLSDHEGNPLALMEAMALGLPVIATSVGGVPDIVEDGKTGYLVPKGDLDLAKQKLELLRHDPQTRSRMSEAAVEHAKVHFSATRMVEEYLLLYESTI